jgi:hypothetical protein
MKSTRFVFGALLLIAAASAQADPIPPVAEASNMTIIGHSDLNGAGKGGEGRCTNIRMAGACCFSRTSRRRCASASLT